MNEGVLWWNYQGHANAYVLSHEGFYRNQNSYRHDYENFLNDGRLFFFSAFSCHANAFGQPARGHARRRVVGGRGAWSRWPVAGRSPRTPPAPTSSCLRAAPTT